MQSKMNKQIKIMRPHPSQINNNQMKLMNPRRTKNSNRILNLNKMKTAQQIPMAKLFLEKDPFQIPQPE